MQQHLEARTHIFDAHSVRQASSLAWRGRCIQSNELRTRVFHERYLVHVMDPFIWKNPFVIYMRAMAHRARRERNTPGHPQPGTEARGTMGLLYGGQRGNQTGWPAMCTGLASSNEIQCMALIAMNSPLNSMGACQAPLVYHAPASQTKTFNFGQ